MVRISFCEHLRIIAVHDWKGRKRTSGTPEPYISAENCAAKANFSAVSRTSVAETSSALCQALRPNQSLQNPQQKKESYRCSPVNSILSILGLLRSKTRIKQLSLQLRHESHRCTARVGAGVSSHACFGRGEVRATGPSSGNDPCSSSMLSANRSASRI